jgi:parvulin-like peptidyl-prolyl isomerase
MQSPRFLSALAAAIIAAVLFGAEAQAAPDSPVASKGGVTYTLEDLQVYFLRMMGKDGLLDFLQSMVVYQEGIKQGLKPTDAEVNDFVQKIMGADVYAQFKQLFSERAVRQMIEYNIVNSKYEGWLRKKLRTDNKITVTEKEASDYFLGHIDEFHLPAGVYISIISVDNKTQAEAVAARLKAGENFNDVAGEVNMDPKMRAARGEIGTYRKGEGLPQPLEDAAFQLRDGQASGIIKGQNYHIIFCHRVIPEVSPKFEEVKEQLMQDMVEAKVDPLYNDSMDELMARELPAFDIKAALFKPEDQPAKPAASGTKPAAKPGS